jgi:hypothetical protein
MSLDELRRAIDDDVYKYGRALTPSADVRRAIARRRTVSRIAVVAVAASVATIVTSGVYVASRTPAHRQTAAVDTTSADEKQKVPSVSASPIPIVPTSAFVEPTPTVHPSPLPLAATVLPAVQWHGSSGSLVLVDPASGAVVKTLTSGLTDVGHDILQQGTRLYFVATTDSHGCATQWSGIDLQSGQPIAAPVALDRPIDAAAISATGTIAVSEGNCAPAHAVVVPISPFDSPDYDQIYASAGGTTVQWRHVAWSPSGTLAYSAEIDGKGSRLELRRAPELPGVEIPVPDGCTPTALTWLQETVVAGLRCTKTDGTSTLTIVRYDASGSLTMRKDVPTAFKEATISDVSAGADGNIYYVVNAEGTDASAYQLTEGADRLIGTNLFYLGDPVPAAGTTATETPTPAASGS